MRLHFFSFSSVLVFLFRRSKALNFRKTCPVAMLSLYSFLVGGKAGLQTRDRVFVTIALGLGATGDYIISHDHKGLAAGAIPFGIGHLFYMVSFSSACVVEMEVR